jgi:hypothetical protein
LGDADEKFERMSALSVTRGLHVFRYVSFDGAGAPAVAKFLIPDNGMSIVDMPGREGGRLIAPGDCLIVRAERAGEARVGLRRGSPDGALEASFRLDVIVRCEEAVAPVAVAPSSGPPISFLAHVARHGDVAFAQNVWVGGPEAPAAIEGLQILADKAAPLSIQVLVGSRPPRWSDWVGAGQYAGSKGYGLPLLGLRLRLEGEAPGQEIAAEALFLGALVASQRGRTVEFLSGSGADPLVGVKIAIEKTSERMPGVSSGIEAQTAIREPRVRVFRASASR